MPYQLSSVNIELPAWIFMAFIKNALLILEMNMWRQTKLTAQQIPA